MCYKGWVWKTGVCRGLLDVGLAIRWLVVLTSKTGSAGKAHAPLVFVHLFCMGMCVWCEYICMHFGEDGSHGHVHMCVHM